MAKKLLVLRNLKTGNWKQLEMDMADFRPSSYPGYRYYKNFRLGGIKEAREYAAKVEQQEKAIADRHGMPPVNPEANAILGD